MVAQGLIDLDELVLRCRDEHARSYIAEAVACYKAGAFRASIVATWIAVVLDILHKLRELELTGNGAAKEGFRLLPPGIVNLPPNHYGMTLERA